MRLHLRFDRHNAVQTRLLLFINGIAAGQLTMPNAEAIDFNQLLSAGSQALSDGECIYRTSGEAPDIHDKK